MNFEEARIEEYKILHAQAADIKARRDTLLAVTLGVFSSLLGIFIGLVTSPDTKHLGSQFLLPFYVALYTLLIASSTLMISHQKHLRRILKYIRVEIEANTSGLNWSSYLNDISISSAKKGGLRGIGNFYILLSITPVTLWFLVPDIGVFENFASLLLFSISLLSSLDIRFAFTSDWKI